VTHLAIDVAAFLFLAYVGVVVLDVVMSLFEQSKVWGCLALTLVIIAAGAIVRYFL